MQGWMRSVRLIGVVGTLIVAGRAAAADLVFENGAVYTVDASRSWAEAVAVADGRIVYVGSTAGAAAHRQERTRVVDLGGRMLLPGFTDSHSHPTGAVTKAVAIYLYDLKSLEAYRTRIREYVARNPKREVFRGGGWSNTLFPPTGPRREDLDAIVNDRPVALASEDGHSTWANSFALKLGGVDAKTPSPPGGVIEKDPKTGEPTGTLRESAARLVTGKLPGYSVDEMEQGLVAFQKMAGERGVTTAYIASSTPGDAGLQALARLEAAARLTVRFRGAQRLSPDADVAGIPAMREERARRQGSLFQLQAVKLFADGVVEGSTAHLIEPYLHKPGYHGEPVWEQAALRRVVEALDKQAFQIHVHAIGDAAIRDVLDALDSARRVNGPRDARPMLTHIQVVAPRDIERFRRLGVIATPQPFWFERGPYYHELEVPYLGRERADREYPMRSFLDAGVVVASASDFPVTPDFSPLLGIQHGVTRSAPDKGGLEHVLGPGERASLEQLIASFTIAGAYASFLEKETGSIEVGKSADLVVLERNLFEVPAGELHRVEVAATYLQGREVFRRP